MARYNEILIGRLNRALTKFTGIKGPAPAPQLGSEFLPVIPFFWGHEQRYIESWDTFWVVNGPGAGGAGNRSGYRLRNPTTSNAMAVVEKVFFNIPVSTTTNPSITLGSATTDLGTTAQPGRALDRRSIKGTALNGSTSNVGALAALTAPTVLLWQANFVTAASGGGGIDVITTDIQEFCLLPGDALQVDAGIDNTGLNFSIRWRERFLEDSERT